MAGESGGTGSITGSSYIEDLKSLNSTVQGEIVEMKKSNAATQILNA